MAVPPIPPTDDDEPKNADAQFLFGDEPERPERPPESGNAAARHEPGGTYDVEEVEAAPERPPVPPVPPAPPRPKRSAQPERSERPARPERDPSEAVEQVWSRWAEWGATLALLTGVGLALAFLIYLALAAEQFGFAMFFLLVGGVTMALLSYPIVITLERPVRVTPEQAVGDFYGALSHHFPHYRRMWLLLSTAGKTSASFASFEGFKNYWKARLSQLRGDRAGDFTPLKFQVVAFKAEKSAGQSVIDARYTVEVFVRGQLPEGPIVSLRVDTSLVRGPDRMWYLDDGTLPAARELAD